MNTIRIASATIISLALGLAVLGAPAAARGPTTRYVDDDGMAGRSGCDGTRSVPRKVQHAIKAAGPGDTILVCPGMYTEQLTIRGARDGLTIRAVEPWTAVIRTPRNLIGSRLRYATRSLITIRGVDRVRVQSLQLAIRTAPPCEFLYQGVVVWNAHDAQVRSLRIEPLGSDTIGRCGYGTGILVDGYGGASAFVGYNLIRDFTGTGIWVYGARKTATLYRNSIRYLHAAEAPDAGTWATGIRAFQAPLVTIRANVIRSGPGPGWPTPVLADGMDLELGDGSVVAGNRVHRTTTYGIYTHSADDSRHNGIVRGNTVTGGPPGSTGLDIIDASTYSGNRVSGYDIGVLAEVRSGRRRVPTIRGNDFRGNDRLDCWNLSQVEFGQPSVWIDNLGDTSDPPGICSPAP